MTKIVICTPGSSFSKEWLDCFIPLWNWCLSNNIHPIHSTAKSNNIHLVRAKCLGADVQRGKHQKPFDGKIGYDYILWIDSDSIFKPEHLQKLLSHNLDIVAGLQAFDGGGGYTCGKLDDEYFKKNGVMEYYTPQNIGKAKLIKPDLIEADYTGFGFLLVKYGVFENKKVEYPWFAPKIFDIDGITDMSMEDTSWCIKARQAGYNINVDTSVRIGHLKNYIY